VRNVLALGAVALAAAAGIAFGAAAGGSAAPQPGLAPAVKRTLQAPSARYAIHVAITRGSVPVALHIRGQESASTISVAMRLGGLRLADGTTVPGPKGAALIDGPFLYERAPSSVVIDGRVRWLRLRLATLPPHSADVAAVHAMTPSSLLHMLEHARMAKPSADRRSFHGTIAYNDAAMRHLSKLTGGIEFRGLRVWAMVGADGLVHRITLTGHTADGKALLSLRARLFGFGRPVHVTPPAPGTFMDRQPQLPA
jgi:hypothetical protein